MTATVKPRRRRLKIRGRARRDEQDENPALAASLQIPVLTEMRNQIADLTEENRILKA